MSTPLATITNVEKRFGTGPPALKQLSGYIQRGRTTGLVGPDGAGKTTLIRLLTGLLLPDVGTIEILGHDTAQGTTPFANDIGYMPQRFGLYEDLTVAENLTLYANLRGLPPADRADRFETLLQFTDLKRFTNRLAGKLSGGMKQKLGLACALLKKPQLLLLDEPSVGVDPISRRELWAMVQELVSDEIGVVWSTAYLDEAQACDHVLLLNAGELLYTGPPHQLTEQVAGRVFKATGFSGRPGSHIPHALAQPDVVDCVVQGPALRLVLRRDATPQSIKKLFGSQTQIESISPRFEDAFVDRLGGLRMTHSQLAELITPREASANQPVIEAQGLTKRFGDFTAASDITFTIPRGEIFGLLGPNGAGKSTTFKMLCGLLKPTSGRGFVAGFDLRNNSAVARNHLGYMAQKFSLYGDLSLQQNLNFFAGIYGLRGRHKRQQIAAMQEIFELTPYRHQSANDLPLGLKQRLALACAVMHQPQALFLDEPTSGVDPLTRREFWLHIHGLVERGVTVLVTTHFMDEAEYCDRIALIYRGESIALGSPEELKSQATTVDDPNPTLESAFIHLVQRSETEQVTSRRSANVP